MVPFSRNPNRPRANMAVLYAEDRSGNPDLLQSAFTGVVCESFYNGWSVRGEADSPQAARDAAVLQAARMARWWRSLRLVRPASRREATPEPSARLDSRPVSRAGFRMARNRTRYPPAIVV